MSHCIACDRLLSDVEASRKHKKTHEEIELCDSCFLEVLQIVEIPYVESGNNFISQEDVLAVDELIASDYLLPLREDDAE